MPRMNESPADNPTSPTQHPSAAPERRGLRRWFKFPRSWKEVKQMGWRMILIFVLFYLIRDSILYLLIPYLVYKGIISL